MNTSDCIAAFALTTSFVGLYFARAAAISSNKSAHAAELSAETSRDALKFDKEKFEESKKAVRKQWIDTLVKEALEKKMANGSAEPFIKTNPDLTPQEAEEIRERFRKGI